MVLIRLAEPQGSFRCTYETITAESAEHGDAEDRGWLDWGMHPVDDHAESDWDLRDLLDRLSHGAEVSGDGDRIPRWITVTPGSDWWLDSQWSHSADDETIAVSVSVHRPGWITDASWLRVCRLLGWSWRWG